MKNVIRTTCPYCGVGCGVLASPKGRIKGDPDHPANFGRLCSKGAALGETLSLDDRVLHPEINGARADWNTALDLVAARFSRAIRDHGPDSVAFYVSGQMLTEDYYVANKLMKGFIGSANIDTNSRLCMASSVAGHRRAFGSDTVPGTYQDLDKADLVVLVGSNLAWCHPVLHQRIMAARKARPGIKLIVIDPRRTASAQGADLHLPIRPDGDSALFNLLLAEIDARGAIDGDFVASNVNGFDAALAAARTASPAMTGLDGDAIKAFLDLWIDTDKVVTIWSQGANQSAHGTDKVGAIINCHLATGRIGRPGMGPFSVTGQPNAMGGREVGGLANMLACHLDIENPEHRHAVQEAWRAPTICTRPGLKAVDLFDACARGDIKALWIIGTNPAVSMPRADRVAAAIRHVPFTVVSDVTRTDTTRLADVVLPALAWGEKSGTVTNSERRISRQRAFLPAPGDARADWRIICDVAARMGWGDSFSYASAHEIFTEYAALSGVAAALGRDFDISGLCELTGDEYANLSPVQWPHPAPPRACATTDGRFFGQGRFFHPDGKARMVPVTAPAVGVAETGRFHLNTGRIRDQWHMMTRTGKSPRLGQHLAEPFAEIHPDDAAEMGVVAGDLVSLRGNGARAVLRVLISDRIAAGQLFVPMHWSAENSRNGKVNPLINAATDPVSGQPALKHGSVEAAHFRAAWYGFAASLTPLAPPRGPEFPYGTIIRTETGHAIELAGTNTPDDWQALAGRLLNLDTADASILLDNARGSARIAFHRNGRLVGLFFAAPAPVELARAYAISLIGSDTPAGEALAGHPVADRPDPGRKVCACFNVGVNTLRAAILAGARDGAALGRATAAGTNCGACKPELDTLIATTLMQIAAE